MHQQIDERSRRDPSLLGKARANLARWRSTCSPRAAAALDEWAAEIEGDFAALLALLVSGEERATRLRQSSPFVGADFLLPEERDDIFREYRESQPA